jgi:NAD(P)-dependent dehydrogenase (short-subunit alcohol dehydrogenase family)
VNASQPFAGRVALVTGAGRGIGRAAALILAAGGADVAVLARSGDELEETAAAVASSRRKTVAVRADMAEPDQVAAAAATATSELGPVDVLINNAAVVAPLGPTVKVDLADWQTAIAVNVTGVFQLTAALLPTMIERGWGRVVNISSHIVINPGGMIGGNAYATTKAALEAHTINLAAEIGATGVTVNAYRPGGVDTAMQGWIRSQPADEIGPALHDRFVTSHREGRLITPERSAHVLVDHLAGDDTGQIWEYR